MTSKKCDDNLRSGSFSDWWFGGNSGITGCSANFALLC